MAENKKNNSNKKNTKAAETAKEKVETVSEGIEISPVEEKKPSSEIPQKAKKEKKSEVTSDDSVSKKDKQTSYTPDVPKKTTKMERPSQKDYSVPANNKKKTSSNAKGNKKKSKKNGEEEGRTLRISTAKDAPFNYAEAYRSLRTNINFIASTEEVKSIVVTSAVPKESKSNVAVNIAVSLATEGKKVILVDCDLRKPVVHQYLKMGRHREGLTEVLAGKAELEDCIAKFKDVKISVLPAGAIPPNPAELLSQKRMKALIRALEDNFDYVIIDAPPVSVVTDAAIISSYVDGAILVVRSKFASIEAIQLAKKRLVDVNAKILGVIVTRYDAKKSTKNTGYSYTYDYNYHYGTTEE